MSINGIVLFHVVILVTLLGSSCRKEENPSLGSVSTSEVENIRRSSANVYGTAVAGKSDTIIAVGFCWNTSGSPTVYDNFSLSGVWPTEFSNTLQGLKPGTKYYLRAYLSCLSGVYYGNERVFKTMEANIDISFNPALQYGSMSDIDGNIYKTIVIKGQEWMAENLRTTHYNDNSAIPLVEDANDWRYRSSPGFCWYENNDTLYRNLYGGYYNWYAVNTGKLCPAGWHVSTDAEWISMDIGLGIDSASANFWYWRGTNQGMIMKEAGNNNWVADTVSGSNETGFTGLPGGRRRGDYGSFDEEGYAAFWWTAEDHGYSWAVCHGLWSFTSASYRESEEKSSGFNVRCIRDKN